MSNLFILGGWVWWMLNNLPTELLNAYFFIICDVAGGQCHTEGSSHNGSFNRTVFTAQPDASSLKIKEQSKQKNRATKCYTML